MPEGPSVLILKELVQQFNGKKIIEAGGTTDIDLDKLQGEVLTDFKTWGKHFLICFKTFTVKIHLMLFGSYRINERRIAKPKLSLYFDKGEINFYASKVELINEDLNELYDWEGDIMNEKWSAKKAKQKLKKVPDAFACDALMDQHIFAGCGNIIKNEVLFRIRVHPDSRIGSIPVKQINHLLKEVRNYAFEFFEQKKKNVLKKYWMAYSKKICPRCNIPLVINSTGKTKRKTFYCTRCQVLHN